MRPQHKRKLIAGLISAAGAAVLAMGSLTAGASAAPNPNEAQATNVPYVAWVGEHVRLVICSDEVTEDALKADVNVIDYQRLRLHVPEVRYDLPKNGRRLLQRVDGYKNTFVSGVSTFEDGVYTGATAGKLVRAA